MNARSIYKRLMRNRAHVIWGRRAFLTVRIPRGVYPERPKFEPPGEPDEFRTAWLLPDGRLLQIHDLSCGRPPDAEDGPAYFLEEKYGAFRWYEVVYHSRNGEERIQEFAPYEEGLALVTAYKGINDWEDKYLHGHTDPEIPVLQALLGAANAAKTTYASMGDKYVYLTYSVKSSYRDRCRRFSSDLSRALKFCKAAGVDVQVRRG